MQKPANSIRPLLRPRSIIATAPITGYLAAAGATLQPFGLAPVPGLGGTWEGLIVLLLLSLPFALTLKMRAIVAAAFFFIIFLTLTLPGFPHSPLS